MTFFACDVLTGSNKATYWDAALCKDSDLHQARSNCHVNIEPCYSNDMNFAIING